MYAKSWKPYTRARFEAMISRFWGGSRKIIDILKAVVDHGLSTQADEYLAS
jgi:hypothetical protein